MCKTSLVIRSRERALRDVGWDSGLVLKIIHVAKIENEIKITNAEK